MNIILTWWHAMILSLSVVHVTKRHTDKKLTKNKI